MKSYSLSQEFSIDGTDTFSLPYIPGKKWSLTPIWASRRLHAIIVYIALLRARASFGGIAIIEVANRDKHNNNQHKQEHLHTILLSDSILCLIFREESVLLE